MQTTAGPLVAAINGLGFAGVGADFVGPQGGFSVDAVPPDPNGAAGATQYVQWVNTSFAVFDKQTGTALYGPAPGDTLWTGFGGPCETNNDGDPIVKYDRSAGRWVLSQLAAAGGPPFFQCIAVSTSIDATGSYNRYAFQFSNLNDYPKLAVWPDAYYVSFNMFQGTTFLGANVCAWDRSQMLSGGAATQQCFLLDPSFGAVLPSDLDGITPPPAGSPNFFVGYGTRELNLWKLHVDFANPANSTLTGPATTAVANFSEACNGGACIPQSGTTQKLDSVGDRLMYRLAYRNFGDHESLVVNHSVSAGNNVGIRWYELRDPNGTPTLYQQSTYAPDSAYRWMGSIAMDKVGNIALGYSVSSSALHPSIRYTGRAPSDPLGTMQAETSIIEGTGSQLPQFLSSLSRWGDYTSLAIDPGDDCTFWYTNQYLQSNGDFNWSTRIASFSFPSCLAAPGTQDFYLSAGPASQAVALGASAGYTVSVTPTGGFSGAVNLQVSGLPAGATAGFSPPSVNGSGSSTLTITAGTGTPVGSYNLTIAGSSSALSHSAVVALVVYIPGFAAFIRNDASTQGTWKGVYGANGSAIANDATSYPAYAQVSMLNQSATTFAASTTDVRALQKSASTTERIASAWLSSTSFTIDLNLVDGNQHRVALYCLDWDNGGRAQTIDLLDGTTSAVLDTRSISAFANGQYLLWNLSGHVTIRVTRTGGSNADVSGIFFDPPGGPDFAVSATPPSQVVAPGGSASYTATITPSLGFSGAVSLSATGLPAGAVATFTPASVTGSGTSTLAIATPVGTPGGTYSITVTGASGALSHSAAVTLVVTASAPAAVVFLKADTTTQGSWKGAYGKDGFAIASDTTSYAPYAQVSFVNQSTFLWAGSTSDVRALQKGAPTPDRIASTWYSPTSFTIDINLIDGTAHRVGIYCLDWDVEGRAQTIDILDAASSSLLDTRSLSGFSGGQYLLWNLTGHVILRLTRLAGQNAVVSGLFFDVASPVAPDFSLAATPGSRTVAPASSTTFTLNVGTVGGFSGAISFAAGGLPAAATASFNPASLTGAGSSTLTVTTAASTPSGTYTVTITGTSGALTHSTNVTLVVSGSASPSAVFVKTDSTTQGTWHGAYGADGYAINNDSTNYPAYALVTFTGQTSYVWTSSTTDVRALQKAASTIDRIASAWYSTTSFTIDINLVDGAPHQLGIYCVDWDRQGRAQTIDVLDAASSALLDTRSVSAFGNGQYMVWNLSGHVVLRFTRTAGQNAVVSGLFFDVAGPTTPDFSISATPASQTVNPGASTSYTVTVAPSGGFSSAVNLSAGGVPGGATASFNPASITGFGSSTVTIATGTSTPGGTYTITITGAGGAVSHSATVTLVVAVSTPPSAVFVKTDSTTQGTWKGVYGANGYAINSDSTSYPAYALVTFTGQTSYVWTSSTTDVRALQKAASTTDRIASTWYSTTSFTIDINLTDGAAHQLGVYCIDWDRQGRAQTIDVLDAASSALLDTRSVSAFGNGQYMVWNLSGHVKLRFTHTAGQNAVVSGLFFDVAGPTTPDFSISATPASQTVNRGASVPYTVTVAPSGGFSSAVNLSTGALPTGVTASYNPASITGFGSSTLTIATGTSTPGGTYTITITGAGGAVSHSATVTLVVAVSVPAAATFVKTDTTTQGTWKGAYGANGYAINTDSTNYPAYALVTFTGPASYVWASSTTDVRALQKAASTTDRIASTWYSTTSFTIDINLSDGNAHQIAVYCVDWDREGRTQTIDILDAASSAVLDTRSVSAFGNGQYLVWNLSGHVKLRATKTAGQNAVVSGIFF